MTSLLLGSSVQALIINGENAIDNYRFVSGYPGSPVPNTDPNFFGYGYDLSGVGWNPSSSNRSYTMISDEYFLFATHYPPGSQVSFYSPVNGVVTYAVDSTFYLEYPQQVAPNHLKSDLAVGRLQISLNPADGLTWYPILDLPTIADYLGLNLLVYGWSAAIGTGVIDEIGTINLYKDNGTPTISSDDSIGSDAFQDTIAMVFIQGANPGEALLESGDSGSPSFVVWNGELALVGTHSAVSDPPDKINFDTFIPAYLNALYTAGVDFTTVPEPGSALLVLTGGLIVCLMGRKRRRCFP